MPERVSSRKTEGSLWMLEVKERSQSVSAIIEQTCNGAEKTKKYLERLLALFNFSDSGKMMKELSCHFFVKSNLHSNIRLREESSLKQ